MSILAFPPQAILDPILVYIEAKPQGQRVVLSTSQVEQMRRIIVVDGIKIDLQPMATFEPSKPSLVHDALRNKMIEWKPEEHLEHYRRHAIPDGSMISWNGLLLDGWKET